MTAANNATILIVDDEPQIRRTLRVTLSAHDYRVIEAKNGREAVETVARERPNLILLDINLPGITGLEVCRDIRCSFAGPIIVISVRGRETDKIAALDSGADDYIVKPFAVGELLARIRAVRRRFSPEERLQKIKLPELTIDFEKRMVELPGQRVHLRPKEFEVLHALALQRGKPVTHERLLQTVWGSDHRNDTENLRVVIKRLRKKIEKDPAHPCYILTHPWTGYRFEVPAAPKQLAP